MTKRWRLRSTSLDLSRGALMAVVNVTPDSFSDGGLRLDETAAIEAGRAMASQGADIIDVGGESTRPGADAVPVDEELRRVLPVIEALASDGLIVSVDTSKPEVARAAVESGAEIINDVTAAAHEEMAVVMADSGAGVILMHMQGKPRTMQASPSYQDVVAEVASFLADRARRVIEAGVGADHIAIDPGIGFGKDVVHNLTLIARLETLVGVGYPVVLGTSRKSFLGRLTGIAQPAERDQVTAVTTALGFERGARVFRVHDVVSSRRALSVAGAIVSPQLWDEWSLD
jgi:dihydropteroate synthase